MFTRGIIPSFSTHPPLCGLAAEAAAWSLAVWVVDVMCCAPGLPAWPRWKITRATANLGILQRENVSENDDII